MLLLAVLAAVIGLGGVSPTGLVQNPRSAAVIQLKLEETDAETTISSTGEFTSSMIEEPKRRINMTGDSYDGWTTIGWDARNRTVGEPVAVGEVVRFQLNATPNVKSKIRMGLCGGQCSVVTSWGISRGPRPQLGHITWVSRSSDINDNMNSHDLKSYTGPWSFASEPYHTFAVERRTETQMVVWAEIDGQRSDEVLLPLTADRDKLFVSSFVGPYRFLSSSNTESKVLTRRTAPGLLVSPLLPGARGGGQHWLCFEVEHGKADTTRDPQPGLLITAEDVHGSRRAVALVQHQSEGWTNSRVLIPWSSEPWRLIISGPPSSMVQAMGECDHSKDDPVQVGELGGEYKSPDAQFVPFNFSSLPKRGPYRADRDAEECFNGGRFNGSGCFCEPGFMGSRCERACTPGFVGDNCDVKCKERLKCTEDESLCSSNCWGSLVCDEIGHCRCAPGFKGERCQTRCDAGEYGAGCALRCGACADASACDLFTGRCPAGCRPGYVGETCSQVLVHMTKAPNVTHVGQDFVEGSVTVAESSTSGSNEALLVDVQYRMRLQNGEWSSDWQSVGMQQLPQPWSRSQWHRMVGIAPSQDTPATEHVLRWRLEELAPSTDVLLRCVLRTAELRGAEDHAPTVRISTLPAEDVALGIRGSSGRLPRPMKVTPVDPWTLKVSWEVIGEASSVAHIVTYQCEKLLACDADCSRSVGLAESGGRDVALTGLLPGARYVIRLAPKWRRAEAPVWETARVTTRFTAPSSVPTRGQVVSVGADHATLRWEDVGTHSCALDNGPRAGFHWELSDGRAGNTTAATLTLRALQPLQKYVLTVYNRGVDGWQRKPPRGPLTIPFRTVAAPPGR